MLKITKRPAKIGASINTRSELEGEERIPAMDIPLNGIMLNATELGELLDDAHAHKALFVRRGKLDEPMFRRFQPFALRDKFEGARVRLAGAMQSMDIELSDCKIGKITLEPQVGGYTELTCQVQCRPDIDADAPTLLAAMGDGIDVQIFDAKRVEKGADKQAELPMEHGAGGDEIDAEARDAGEFEAAAKAQVDAYERGKPARGRRRGRNGGQAAAH